MMIFITKDTGDRFLVMARAEGDGIIGDAEVSVGPGDKVFGVSYEDIKKHGPGAMEVP